MTKRAAPVAGGGPGQADADAPAWPSTRVATAFFLALSFAYFLPAFLPGQHIYGSDYFAGGYFFYHFISERLAAGDLPKWVPYIFGGLPLFANPGSTYHPVHFLAELALPTSRVLPVVFVVHFWLAGVGMFLLAVELGCRRWVALVAGVTFQFTGLIASWVYAGHDGRIIVATLAPMFFFLLHRGVRTARPAPFAGAALTLGSALLSFQIQNSYYLLLAAAIWAVFCLVHLGRFREPRALGKVAGLGLGAVALGFLLAAVNFLPFLDYIPETARGMEGGRGYEYSTSYSMPAGEIVALAVPEQHGVSVADPLTGEPLFPAYHGANGFKLHTEYVGALTLVLLALGAFYSRGNRYWWFFAALSLFMLTIALGGSTPLYRLYYALLPGTKQFRAPSLSFFVVAMSLVAMGALTLERIARLREGGYARPSDADEQPLGRLPWIAGGVVGLALLGLLLTAGGPAAGGPTAAQGWGRFALFSAAAAGALWLWVRGTLTTALVAVALVVVSLTDLWLVGKRFLHTVPPPEVTFAPDDVMSFLLARPQPERVWTFPIPSQYRGGGPYGGDYPMLFGIQQAGGEHPNQLQRWNEYLGAGTETYIDWHNLISEAGVVETPQGQAIAFRGEPGFLDAANIRYVVSMAPLRHPSLREVHRGSALVYENVSALPRAYLVPRVEEVAEDGMLAAMTGADWDPREVAFVPAGVGAAPPGGPLEGSAEVVAYEPDRVVVRASASRPALLVLADNYHAAWQAHVDGREAPVVRANHTMRGVVVPAGAHEVTFEFVPRDLYTGLAVTLAAFAALTAYGGYLLLGRRAGRDATDAAPAA